MVKLCNHLTYCDHSYRSLFGICMAIARIFKDRFTRDARGCTRGVQVWVPDPVLDD